MKLFEGPYERLTKEAIQIFLDIKCRIKDNTDCGWTYYSTAEQMHSETGKYIAALEKGDIILLDEMYMHFLPTAGYQEHSVQNDWTVDYHKLAERFDKIYDQLKQYK